jgi:hypothetical protein
MSLLKNSYADLYNDATGGGGGGGPPVSLSSLNDCNNNTLIDSMSIGIKAPGINTAGNVIIMNDTPTFTNIGIENTLVGNCCKNTNGGVGFYANTVLGSGSLSSCTADSNTCLGNQSGAFVTTGARNTFCGVESGQGSSIGSDNICYGFSSGVGMVNASRCTMIGSSTENSGDVNDLICIGYQARGNVANGLFFPPTLAPVVNNTQTKLMTFNNLSGNAGPTVLASANGYLQNTGGILSWAPINPALAGYAYSTIATTPFFWDRDDTIPIVFETIHVDNANGSISVVNTSTFKFEQAGIYQIETNCNLLSFTSGTVNISIENWNTTTNTKVGSSASFSTGSNNINTNEIIALNSFSIVSFNQNDEFQFKLNAVNTPVPTGSSGALNNVLMKITKIAN